MSEKMFPDEEIERMFTYIPPKAGQPERYEKIRNAAKELALIINESCPDSPQKYQAIMLLTQSNMMANASIAINE